jgi:UDPglucose 6-dehydrogenase
MEKIAVIGIGRLGLCLALNLEKAGYKVTGVDVSEEYVDSLNHKTFQSPEPFVNELLKASINFIATSSLNEVFTQGITTLFVVLPTPSLANGSFDHQYINSIVEKLVEHGFQNQTHHLIINSTTMPGYCDELQLKMKAFNYEVIYNPEFIAQGSIISDQLNPDQVLIGEGSKEAGEAIEFIYKKMCRNNPTFCRMSRISAEITKLATNCFLTTKIAFANSIGDIAKRVGAEPEKVLDAIGLDSRIGNKYFKYGFGYGGPCFPRDNRAFTKFASDKNYKMLISEATDKANELHGAFLFEEWSKKNSDVEPIVFDFVTYKKGTDILEESQQLKLAVALAKSGKKVIVKESGFVIKTMIDTYGNLFIYEVNDK